MNEQIKALAQQADEYAEQTVHYYMGQFDGLTWEGKIKQTRDTKFAELIVRECAMIVEGFEITQEVALDEYVDYEASSVLKEHFGVEE